MTGEAVLERFDDLRINLDGPLCAPEPEGGAAGVLVPDVEGAVDPRGERTEAKVGLDDVGLSWTGARDGVWVVPAELVFAAAAATALFKAAGPGPDASSSSSDSSPPESSDSDEL